MMLLYIASAIILVYCTFIAYITFHLRKPEAMKSVAGINAYSRVSVIIPCRNEAENIMHCLNSISKQTLSKERFEIILVDDFSEDHTIKVAEHFKGRLPVTILHNDIPGKKNALTLGIASAENEIIVTTDADCTMHEHWLEEMLMEFETGQLNMLCGPINFNDSGSLFGQLQQAESVAIVGISMAMLNNARPATCNGANLMYRKVIFDRIGGYRNHSSLVTGDDDLLMHEFFRVDASKVRYSTGPDAMVYTAPCVDFSQFLDQRIRWLSKRKKYQYRWNSDLQLLILAHLLSFWFLVYQGFANPGLMVYGIIVLKYAIDIIYGMRLRSVFAFRLLLVLLMPFFESYIIPVVLFSRMKKIQWKGRPI